MYVVFPCERYMLICNVFTPAFTIYVYAKFLLQILSKKIYTKNLKTEKKYSKYLIPNMA